MIDQELLLNLDAVEDIANRLAPKYNVCVHNPTVAGNTFWPAFQVTLTPRHTGVFVMVPARYGIGSLYEEVVDAPCDWRKTSQTEYVEKLYNALLAAVKRAQEAADKAVAELDRAEAR